MNTTNTVLQQQGDPPTLWISGNRNLLQLLRLSVAAVLGHSSRRTLHLNKQNTQLQPCRSHQQNTLVEVLDALNSEDSTDGQLAWLDYTAAQV